MMLTPEQLAARWNTSESYLGNLRYKKKGCPYVKRGRSVMYRLEDVRSYENARRVATAFVRPKVRK